MSNSLFVQMLAKADSSGENPATQGTLNLFHSFAKVITLQERVLFSDGAKSVVSDLDLKSPHRSLLCSEVELLGGHWVVEDSVHLWIHSVMNSWLNVLERGSGWRRWVTGACLGRHFSLTFLFYLLPGCHGLVIFPLPDSLAIRFLPWIW